LIATAREIHDACRGTPWDWMVYYAAIDVYGFISEPDPQHIDLPPRSDLRILDGGLPVPAGSWSDPNPKARIDPTVGSEE
jgi:hypothetical protein